MGERRFAEDGTERMPKGELRSDGTHQARRVVRIAAALLAGLAASACATSHGARAEPGAVVGAPAPAAPAPRQQSGAATTGPVGTATPVSMQPWEPPPTGASLPPTRRLAASETPESSNGWQLIASAYLWLPNKRGVIDTSNTAIALDDPDESTGGFLYLEGERGRWGFIADLDLLSSTDETPVPTGTIKVEEDSVIGELDATWRAADASTLQFLAGVRVLDSSQDITFPILPASSSDVTQVDPVVGAQGTWPLGRRFTFRLRGDVGGFGIDSDLTYQMFGVFAWEFASHWGLTAGYRILGWEFDADGVHNDLRLSGVLLGVAVSF